MYKLLLVDDNKLSRDAIEFIIKSNHLPFDISQARNGVEALECIKTGDFDCVITDIKMPRMSGVELVKQSRINNYKPIFLICSGYRDFSDAKEAIEYGVENYILKPIDVMEFLKIMSDIIKRLEENSAKKEEDLDKELHHYLNGGVTDESDRIKTILDNLTRIIVIKFRGTQILNHRDEIKQSINNLYAGSLKYIQFDKNTDIILCVGADTSEKHTSDYIMNVKQIYNKVARNNFSISASKILESSDMLIQILTETIKVSENKLFQADPTTSFTAKSENLTGETVMIGERMVYNAIEQANCNEIKEQINEYFNLLQVNLMVSTIFIKFQASSFIKAIVDKFNKDFYTESVKAIEDIGSAETIVELKRIMCNFVDMILEKQSSEISESSVIKTVKKLIELEFQSNITLEYLASKVYLSPAYLSNAFKQQVGVNLFSYIATVRMQKGKQLLMSTSKKIIEISKAVGYDSPSYFNRIFKLHYGMTPKEFRKSNK